MFQKQNTNTIELLKWIAIITMVIDHLGIYIYRDLEVLREIGRVAFPLFGYILIHNYLFFTTNKLRYIKRLFIFSLISQPIFWFFLEHSLNIFFLLSLSLFTIYIFEKIEKMNRKKVEKIIAMGIIIILSIGLSFLIEYPLYGLLFLISIYLSFLNIRYIPLQILTLLSVNMIHTPLYGLLYMPIIYLSSKVNIKIKRVNKWFFYLFYPTHILIFGIIYIYLNN